MSTPALEQILPRLMRFARVIQGIARRFTGLARALALSGLASALLLDWLATRAWGLSLTWAVALGVILLLPGLVLGWAWYVLAEAADLPRRIAEWAAQARGVAGDVARRLGTESAAGNAAEGKVSELRSLGGLSYDLAAMGLNATDLMGIVGGALSFTNPLFLLVLLIAAGVALLLDVSAVIALLAALF